MIRRVRFTPPARAQFLAAVASVRADRPSAARDFKTKALRDLERVIRVDTFRGSYRSLPTRLARGSCRLAQPFLPREDKRGPGGRRVA